MIKKRQNQVVNNKIAKNFNRIVMKKASHIWETKAARSDTIAVGEKKLPFFVKWMGPA